MASSLREDVTKKEENKEKEEKEKKITSLTWVDKNREPIDYFDENQNVLSPGSNHRSIDNDLIDFVIEDIKNFIEGKDAVKIAKDRKLPTFDPKKSNSPNISFNDYENKPNRA